MYHVHNFCISQDVRGMRIITFPIRTFPSCVLSNICQPPLSLLLMLFYVAVPIILPYNPVVSRDQPVKLGYARFQNRVKISKLQPLDSSSLCGETVGTGKVAIVAAHQARIRILFSVDSPVCVLDSANLHSPSGKHAAVPLRQDR